MNMINISEQQSMLIAELRKRVAELEAERDEVVDGNVMAVAFRDLYRAMQPAPDDVPTRGPPARSLDAPTRRGARSMRRRRGDPVHRMSAIGLHRSKSDRRPVRQALRTSSSLIQCTRIPVWRVRRADPAPARRAGWGNRRALA